MKPKKRRSKPYRQRPCGVPSMLIKAYRVLAPIEAIIEQLDRDGCVTTDQRGVPIVVMPDGDFYETAPAVLGLATLFDMWAVRHGRELNTEPLYRFANKLEHAMPFAEADVRDVTALIPVLRRIASTMDEHDAADLTRQTQIKAELENRSVA